MSWETLLDVATVLGGIAAIATLGAPVARVLRRAAWDWFLLVPGNEVTGIVAALALAVLCFASQYKLIVREIDAAWLLQVVGSIAIAASMFKYVSGPSASWFQSVRDTCGVPLAFQFMYLFILTANNRADDPLPIGLAIGASAVGALFTAYYMLLAWSSQRASYEWHVRHRRS